MTELAYRHCQRGKAHRRHPDLLGLPAGLLQVSACRGFEWGGWKGSYYIDRIPVDQLNPAELCKRCWPERAA